MTQILFSVRIFTDPVHDRHGTSHYLIWKLVPILAVKWVSLLALLSTVTYKGPI